MQTKSHRQALSATRWQTGVLPARVARGLVLAGLLLAVTASAGIVEFQWHLQRTLRDEGSTAVDCQRAIVQLLAEADGFSEIGRAHV